jgi:hypothetical protein
VGENMNEEKHTYTAGEGAQALEVEFTWRNLSEYHVREYRAKPVHTMNDMTPTKLSLIQRGYCHQGRLMLFRLPYRSWRTAVTMGKGIRRGRELKP